jgi:hypothetical protein
LAIGGWWLRGDATEQPRAANGMSPKPGAAELVGSDGRDGVMIPGSSLERCPVTGTMDARTGHEARISAAPEASEEDDAATGTDFASVGASGRDAADDWARAVIGQDDPALAARVRDWRAEQAKATATALEEWQRRLREEGPAVASAAFNRRAEQQVRAAERAFGRPLTERLARAGGFHRADPVTGEINAVDLDGRVLAPPAD